LETGQAFTEKAFPPLADDLPRDIEMFADLLVLETPRGEQDDLGADDVTIR
jgi:hypothetical protein